VEFWFEKGAVMSVVEGLHREYQVTMRPFKGQASRTYCANIAKDFSRVEKPVTVYYCGDHDPSGYAIPRSGANRVREILRKDYNYVNADFTFIRLGFNARPTATPCEEWEGCEVCNGQPYLSIDHFEEHDLPAWDVEEKKKDSNYQWFVNHFGEKCAEIDAIPPDELRTMIKDAITSHISDPESWKALKASEKTDRDAIAEALRPLL
jgi:hypothetical protein